MSAEGLRCQSAGCTAADLGKLDMVGPDEIAARLGVARNTPCMWRIRHLNFPEEWLTVSHVPMWPWSVVREWAIDTGRLA